MRRLLAPALVPAVATAATLALTVGLTLSTTTGAVSAPASAATGPVAAKKAAAIPLKKSAKGVQPGLKRMKITAKVKGAGKVKFTLTGKSLKKSQKVKIKKGKAVYKVPALGTGKYVVKAKYGKRVGKTKFKVYNSSLTVNTTTFRCSTDTGSYYSNDRAYTPLSGRVKFKGKWAKQGYVDLYKDGKNKGGNSSPNFLGFLRVNTDPAGTFDDGTGGFCYRVVAGGTNTPAFGPGTYRFQAYYTPNASYDDYVSSNFLTVTVYDPAT